MPSVSSNKNYILFILITDCCVTSEGVTLDCCLSGAVPPGGDNGDDKDSKDGEDGDGKDGDVEDSKSNKTRDLKANTEGEDDGDEKVTVRRRRKIAEGEMR